MLVLSRRVGERILIGDDIRVTVVRVAQGVVRLGIEAPENMPIVREEILEQHASRTERSAGAGVWLSAYLVLAGRNVRDSRRLRKSSGCLSPAAPSPPAAAYRFSSASFSAAGGSPGDSACGACPQMSSGKGKTTMRSSSSFSHSGASSAASSAAPATRGSPHG